MLNKKHSLGIVGLGPRGQYALECLVRTLATEKINRDVSILLFEETDQIGNGPVWSVDQTPCNWSNVTERVLDLPPRDPIILGQTLVPEFPSYHTWAHLDFDTWPTDRVDWFPPRRDIGSYLAERCQSLVQPLVSSAQATLVKQRVDDVSVMEDGVRVTTRNGSAYFVEQVLLTIGHQPTALDDQLEAWEHSATVSSALQVFTDPYPVERILKHTADQSDTEIAIRGFGLSTIDIVRAIAEQFGTFAPSEDESSGLRYRLTRDVKVHLVPFSLDGLPMAAKPLTPALDARFKPSAETLSDLYKRLKDPVRQDAANDENFLLDEMVPITARIFCSLEDTQFPVKGVDIEDAIRRWVRDQRFNHPCVLNVERPTRDLMVELVKMATGNAPVSLDYCLGQVWRHCLATIYAALSHSHLSNRVLANIIDLDERVKRYSFGPPVESLRQLIALADAGVLDLRFLHDPEIEEQENCWVLSNGSETFATSTMVNAVLDPPDIKAVSSRLVRSLIEDGVFAQAHDGLGVLTSKDGFVEGKGRSHVPIAVLGRLAKGSVIGVDSILQCFGERPRQWAQAAVDRLG